MRTESGKLFPSVQPKPGSGALRCPGRSVAPPPPPPPPPWGIIRIKNIINKKVEYFITYETIF